MTTAVANAIAISLDKNAAASYRSQVAREEAEARGAVGQSPEEYRATLRRLGAFAELGGAVKVH